MLYQPTAIEYTYIVVRKSNIMDGWDDVIHRFYVSFCSYIVLLPCQLVARDHILTIGGEGQEVRCSGTVTAGVGSRQRTSYRNVSVRQCFLSALV